MYNNPYQYGPMGYNYGPAPDQLTQLRQQQTIQPMQQPMMGQQMGPANGTQPMMQGQGGQPQTPPNGSNMIWVSRKEAEDFIVGPNCSVSMWDKDEDVAYIKSADSTGKPTMRILDYTERMSALRAPVQAAQAPAVQFVTREEFDALAAELEALKAKKCTCKVKKEDADNG